MSAGQETREKLIQAARFLAGRKGFDRMSVSEIVAEAGVKKGSLYHFFPGKDDLGLAVLEADRTAFLAMLDSALGSTGDPRESLSRFFDAALEKHSETGFVGGCLWGNTALEMSDSNSVYARFVAGVFDEWVDRIKSVIRRGQDNGQFRNDRPARDLARLVVAGIEGGIMLSRLTKSADSLASCVDSLKTLLCMETKLNPNTERIR